MNIGTYVGIQANLKAKLYPHAFRIFAVSRLALSQFKIYETKYKC